MKLLRKTKNEHFLKKLDKDRIQKNCEFAVLVSMLEKEDESYNVGIRDMSHLYEKNVCCTPAILCANHYTNSQYIFEIYEL